MALSGISRKTIYKYVPVDDRETEPEDEQTVFHIRPKLSGDGSRSATRYMNCRKSNPRGGFDEWDFVKMRRADQDEFIDNIAAVENWKFSTDHGGDGKTIIKLIDNTEDLKKLFQEMSNDLLNEILEVVSDISKLKEGEKKSLNSSSILTTGKPKNLKDKKSMTVTHVEE